jgi:hypothetical protein
MKFGLKLGAMFGGYIMKLKSRKEEVFSQILYDSWDAVIDTLNSDTINKIWAYVFNGVDSNLVTRDISDEFVFSRQRNKK